MPAAVAIPAIIALAGTAASVAESEKSRKAAMQAADQQAQQQGYANAEAKRQYDQQQALYGPARQKLINENMAATPDEYAKYADLVRQQYSPVTRQNLNGAVSNSGLASANIQNADLSMAGNLAGAYAAAKDKQQQALMQLLGGDRSAQTGQNYLNSMNNQANFYGNQAAMLGQNSAKQMQAGIAGLSGVGSAIGKMMTPDNQYGAPTAPDISNSPSMTPMSMSKNNPYQPNLSETPTLPPDTTSSISPTFGQINTSDVPGYGMSAQNQAFGGSTPSLINMNDYSEFTPSME